MVRLSKDDYFMQIAYAAALRSTCPRRQVGCVVVDAEAKILSTGYNGVPKGFPHCIDTPCGGEKFASGQGLSSCMATHAEANALIQCSNIAAIHTIYVTTTPCIECAKLIANTGCKRVVSGERYCNSGEEMLKQLGIEVDYA
jgi:dCMP deaminase